MSSPLAVVGFLLLPAPAPQDAPRAVAHWVIEQGGAPLGHCASRDDGLVDVGGLRAHVFHDQVELMVPAGGEKLVQRFTVERWLDGDGHPLRFVLRAQVGDTKSEVSGTFANGKAECVVRQGPTEQTVSVPVWDEVFLLANNFVAHLEPLLALDPEQEKRSVTLFSANALKAFPYTMTRKSVAADGTATVTDSLGETFEVSPDGSLARVTAGGVVFRRVADPVEFFTIEIAAASPAVADLEREDVEIVDGAVKLAGTLTRKKGTSGRLPAVFFLSGSGGQDREGYSSGLDIGTHELLDRLTREGFLVLRVDDRGVGRSTGPTKDLTFVDLVEDGRRAVRFLAARPDVDPAHIALIGHSEGGISGPILATEEPIAALVLMAAPGRPLEELLREQLLAGRKAEGASAEELTAFGSKLDGFLDAVAEGKPIEAASLPAELAAFVPARAWLASHLGRDPLKVLGSVHCPVLIVQGGRDVQVSAERDAPKLVAALDAAKHPDHELKVFPTLDHLFKVAGDPPSELDYFKARPVDGEFLDVVSAWLRARLMR